MKIYHDLLNDVLKNGKSRSDRTGTGTISVFGRQVRHDLNEGFPLLTTKKLHWKSIAGELLWFLSGESNIAPLHKNGITIWDEWATEDGELGPVYGVQWRKWPDRQGGTIDQIGQLVHNLKTNPYSRRHLFHGWNVAYLPDETISPQDNVRAGRMALPPCHLLYQFYVQDDKLSCLLYIRSNDLFLGHPYNLASAALLTHMLAHQCDLGVGEVILSIGDLHLYQNHFEQARLQLTRDIRPLPTLKILRKPNSIFEYELSDFVIEGYDPHPTIKAQISI
ncbi:MAG: thymidylate synthase [Gammaproteobacteria bacterium]|nr:thymidylate synthase [Gammaproteobacteria bacterium]